jgi:hypothetical protein
LLGSKTLCCVVGLQYITIRKAKEFVNAKGILSTPNPKPGKSEKTFFPTAGVEVESLLAEMQVVQFIVRLVT